MKNESYNSSILQCFVFKLAISLPAVLTKKFGHLMRKIQSYCESGHITYLF